jgi:peroxiredoxin
LQPIIKQWQEDGVEVALITTDSPAKIEGFLTKNSLDVTVLFDDRGEVVRLYQVGGIPDGMLVDSQGTLLYRSLGWGAGSLDRLQAEIDKVLEGN